MPEVNDAPPAERNEGERQAVLHVVAVGVAGFAALAKWSTGSPTIGVCLIAAAPLFLGLLAGTQLRKSPVLIAAWLTFLCLVVVGPLMREGVICVLLYMPLAVPLAMLAALLGVGARAALGRSASLLILVPWLGVAWEAASPPERPRMTVTSEALVERSIGEVWDSLDRLHLRFAGGPPTLARLLLPAPLAIEGGGTHAGALRRIQFDNGEVVARVVRAERPASFEVELSIARAGREFFDHWVALERSTFTLAPAGERRTRIAHATTYRSRLFPRWYWAPLERRLADLVQGAMLDAYARAIAPAELAQNGGAARRAQ